MRWGGEERKQKVRMRIAGGKKDGTATGTSREDEAEGRDEEGRMGMRQ
jgi:hypothetical protein